MDRSVLLAVVALTVACGTAAHAVSPEPPEGLLCMSSYVFAGHVVAAKGENYTRPDRITSYWPERRVDLSVVVRDIVGIASAKSAYASGPVLSVADTVEVVTEVTPNFDFDGGFSFDNAEAGIHVKAVSPPWLSDELVASAFTGKDFIFSAWLEKASGIRYRARLWQIDRRKWILETMERAQRQTTAQTSFGGTDCPSAVERTPRAR